MGLAERKNKQKIGSDPRNLTWSQDTNRFSFQHLQKFGWDPSKGLGTANDGNPNHIKVVKKLDAGGIGVNRALKEGAEIGGAGEGLDAVLKRLKATGSGPIVFNDDDEEENGESAVSSEKEESEKTSVNAMVVVPIVAPEPRKIMAARNKYIKSKRLASQSPAAMAEILGIPVSALPSSGASTPVPTLHKAHINTSSALSGEPISADSGDSTPTTETPLDDGRAENMLTTSTLSVYEYFRRKLAQKKAEREGLPVPEMSYVPEGYNEVSKDFEGKKIKFEMEDEDEDDQPVNSGIGSEPSADASGIATTAVTALQTKEERKALQKANKEAEKAAKKAAKAAKKQQEAVEGSTSSKRDKKRKRDDSDVETERKSSKGKEKATDDVDAAVTAKEAKKAKKDKRESKNKRREILSTATLTEQPEVSSVKGAKVKKEKRQDKS